MNIRALLLVLTAVVAPGLAPNARADIVCRNVPTQIEPPTARDAFGGSDPVLFAGARGPLETALNAICAGDGANARLFRKQVRRVVFRMAAGATEPTPLLERGVLAVEFHGGTFQAARFRQKVRDALRGEPRPDDD